VYIGFGSIYLSPVPKYTKRFFIETLSKGLRLNGFAFTDRHSKGEIAGYAKYKVMTRLLHFLSQLSKKNFKKFA